MRKRRMPFFLRFLPQQPWMEQPPSLALKLTLIITTIAVTAVGATTLLAIQREQRTYRSELQQQAILMLDTLEVTLRDPLYRLDVKMLEDVMDTLGQHQAFFKAGYVYDGQGRLLADATRQDPIYDLKVDLVGAQLVNQATTLFEWQSAALIAGRAVSLGQQPVGAIRVEISTAPLQHKIVAARNRGMAIAALAAVLSALVAQWVSRSITKPVHQLLQGTQRIAQGEFDHPIRIKTGDELSILASAFNEMGSQLQQMLSLLEQQNEDLEDRVTQRTAELTQTLTELQETQTQLIQSEKMSSLGQLVAGIAHEVNNPVNFVHGNLQHLRGYTQDLLILVQLYQAYYPDPIPEIVDKLETVDLPFLKADLAKLLKSMEMGTRRIQEIVVSLRNFSRIDESDRKAVNVHEGIDSTLEILQHRLKATDRRPAIQVCKDYGDLPLVACYPGQLNQVIMNLLANAIDALDENNSGRSYADLVTHPHIIQIQTRVAQPGWVTIAIQDNGSGIPEALQSKLFNPFFTTKPIGQGTGMGLSISYRIIEKHGGKLYVDPACHQGGRFVIDLPIQGH